MSLHKCLTMNILDVNIMLFQEVQGRALRLNLAADRTSSSTPSMEESAENNVDSSELVSTVST